MVEIQYVGYFLAFWAGLYLLDIVLQSRKFSHNWYSQFMYRNGISISIAQVKWYTIRFNRTFMKIGQWSPWIIQTWFSIGVVFGFFAQVGSVYLLSYLVYSTMIPEKSGQVASEEKVLTPVMPGVNLPNNQLGYYLMTLLVCGILHEAGHAVAAVSEKVKVNGFGVFFLALYPGAFVDLNTEHLHSLSPFKQLRIYCAGIWHNFVIAVVALGILIISPQLMSVLYQTGQGAVITHVVKDSPVWGPKGMDVGNVITQVDSCHVTSTKAWLECVQRIYGGPQIGYCVRKEFIKVHDTSIMHFRKENGEVECCSNNTQSHICFKCVGRTITKLFSCLPARVVSSSRSRCRLGSQCLMNHICAIPSLDNSTTRFIAVDHGTKEPLLFLGHPMDLIYSLQTSDYNPKSRILPLNIPTIVQTFCKYLVSLSGALVVLNVVPCYALDGQWILHAFIDLYLANYVSRDNRLHIFSIILLLGTLLLLTNIMIALWTLFA